MHTVDYRELLPLWQHDATLRTYKVHCSILLIKLVYSTEATKLQLRKVLFPSLY